MFLDCCFYTCTFQQPATQSGRLGVTGGGKGAVFTVFFMPLAVCSSRTFALSCYHFIFNVPKTTLSSIFSFGCIFPLSFYFQQLSFLCCLAMYYVSMEKLLFLDYIIQIWFFFKLKEKKGVRKCVIVKKKGTNSHTGLISHAILIRRQKWHKMTTAGKLVKAEVLSIYLANTRGQ